MQLINKKGTPALLIGLLFFTFLFYISWVYFKEKMLCFDLAFFSFLMIDTNDFSFALGRWGSVFTQVIPLIALKNDCSLETFLRLYSISPVVIYFLIFVIIYLLKNYHALLVLLLSLSLGFRHAFYYTTAELYIGIAFTVLLWAVIAPEKEYLSSVKKNIALLFCLLLVYTMSYLHQLTLFTILFVLIFEFISFKKYKNTHLWILTLATIGWYFIRIFVFSATEYESGKIPTLSIFIEQIPNLRYLPSTIYFKYFAVYQLWPLFIILFTTWIYLIKTKQWLAAIFLPLYSIAYLILILITYHKGESPLMYENYYTVFGVFASISFVFVLQQQLNMKWQLIIVTLFLIVNLNGIYNSHHILTKRIEYISRLVDYGRKQENKKFLLNAKNFPWQIGWVSWGLPFETTLFSALDGPDSVVTFFITNDMNKYDSLIDKENIFLGPEFSVTWFGSQNLNKKYFHFPSTGYQKLNSAQTDSSFNESVFNHTNIQIIPLQKVYYSDADSFIVAPVLIRNLSEENLASTLSGQNPVSISYHIYNKEGVEIIHDGSGTPLDADVASSYVQGINITLPKEQGIYTVEVDFVSENKRWWNINSGFELFVE
jgi:hypothetical protein